MWMKKFDVEKALYMTAFVFSVIFLFSITLSPPA
jgi:hypothetical protein